MQGALAASPAWTIDGLEAKDGLATVDLARPDMGLAMSTSSGVDHVLGLDLRMPPSMATSPSDHWVRGGDVVAVYRPADPRRLEATAMWRRHSARRDTWELILSAQTALVESDGSLAVISEVASGEVRLGCTHEGATTWLPCKSSTPCLPGVTSVLIQRATDAVLIAVHPTDNRSIVVSPGGDRTRITCWLFSAAIEKGVLHRGRVLVSIGCKDDTGWADELIHTLAASPPPLTA